MRQAENLQCQTIALNVQRDVSSNNMRFEEGEIIFFGLKCQRRITGYE